MSSTMHHGMSKLEKLMASVPAPTAATTPAAAAARRAPPTIATAQLFGRLVDTPNPVAGYAPQEALDRLSRLLHGMSDPTDPASDVPAGYTFFGQFVDHDLTFDVTSELGRRIDPAFVRNVRTPTLDLDCVYGAGPDGTPHLYSDDKTKKGHLLVGREDNPDDLARTCEGVALIGDPRNDENGLVSQIQVLFIRFANLMLHAVTAPAPSPEVLASAAEIAELRKMTGSNFEIARTLVRWHYQWLILHDFLPRFVDREVLDAVVAAFRAGGAPAPFTAGTAAIPIEFAAAAYRFGHATVQNSYVLRRGGAPFGLFPQAGVPGIPAFGPKAPALTVDLDMFFSVPGAAAPQMARPIGTKIAEPLFRLPFVSPMADPPGLVIRPQDQVSLPHRNVIRDRFTFELASGRQFAAAVGKPRVPPNAAAVHEGITKAPLWYYILQEAEERHHGRLGWVGGTIVAGTLIRLLVLDDMSVWHHPNWTPKFGVGADGGYSLGHLSAWVAANRSTIDFWDALRCPRGA